MSSELTNLFTEFVRQHPDARVLDHRRGDRKAADFLFRDPPLLVELKCFETDTWSKVKGYLVGHGVKGIEQLQEADDRIVADAFKKAGSPFLEHLKKANRQLKSSRKELALPEALGVLLVANDSVGSIDHVMAVACIAQLVAIPNSDGSRRYSAIDYVVYMHFVPGGTVKHGSKDAFPFAIIPSPSPPAEAPPGLRAILKAWAVFCGAKLVTGSSEEWERLQES